MTCRQRNEAAAGPAVATTPSAARPVALAPAVIEQATRVLASIVYQATPRDPLVLAGVVLAMLLVGLVATWIPAQRALSLDPLTLLREE